MQTKTNLVIVESPAKAKTIKKYLGKNYVVMASMGHLRDLPKSQLGVDVSHQFQPKYITIRGKGDLVNSLKKAAKSADKVYLATDPDREGEAIAWHLATLLGVDIKSKCRVSFNEITKTAIQSAIKVPKTIDLDLVDAQQARRVLDRIIGYKLSPLLWKKVRTGLSAGRVQSVTTRMVVDREREIEDFTEAEYWTISAMLYDDKPNQSFEARFHGLGSKKTELPNEDCVKEILKKVENANYTVTSVKYKERKKLPSPPFITSTLQQEASRKLGFTAKRTMAAAQLLYEGVDISGKGTMGLITYMRTDSLRISEDAQKEAREFIINKYGEKYVPKTPRTYQSRKNAQDAHEAIRPTTMLEADEIKESLSSDAYKLYKLIYSRFIASQMQEALYDTMNADIEANGYTFKASGAKITFLGFTKVYTEGSDEEGEKEDNNIVKLTQGMVLNKKELTSKQHFTEPPPRYTEASLIKALEEKGIGRPSTYAPTITTVIGRGYVEREKKALRPTELGMIITDLMTQYFDRIVDVEFTAGMESSLDNVEEGKIEWIKIIDEFYGPFEKELSKAEDVIGKIEIKDEESDVICDKCGRNMVIKAGRFGKFLACPGFPDCKNTKPIIEETPAICPLCGGRVIARKSQKGKKYFTCEKAPDCKFLLWDEPTGEHCPKCNSLMVKKYSKNGDKTVCSNRECEGSKSK